MLLSSDDDKVLVFKTLSIALSTQNTSQLTFSFSWWLVEEKLSGISAQEDSINFFGMNIFMGPTFDDSNEDSWSYGWRLLWKI